MGGALANRPTPREKLDERDDELDSRLATEVLGVCRTMLSEGEDGI